MHVRRVWLTLAVCGEGTPHRRVTKINNIRGWKQMLWPFTSLLSYRYRYLNEPYL